MKADLATSIVITIVGAIVAYFCCNLFIGESEDFSFKNIDSSVSTQLAEPDPEVFNYKALNPTVEAYVGNCTEYNVYGQCVEEGSTEISTGTIEDSAAGNTDSNNTSNQKDK